MKLLLIFTTMKKNEDKIYTICTKATVIVKM